MTIDRAGAQRWLDGYLSAWSSNDPDELRALFAEDARYFTLPTRDPLEGREAVVRNWLAYPDEPGSWHAELEVIAVDGDLAIVQGQVDYTNGNRFANLWVIEFAEDGSCRQFTEWWLSR